MLSTKVINGQPEASLFKCLQLFQMTVFTSAANALKHFQNNPLRYNLILLTQRHQEVLKILGIEIKLGNIQ